MVRYQILDIRRKSLKSAIYYLKSTSGELAQLARAPALHAGGQGFDSLILHSFGGLI